MWGLQPVLLSAMPTLLTFDILMQFSTILPTAISDGATEYNIDLIFGALFVLLFVNLLPALQLASRSTSACCLSPSSARVPCSVSRLTPGALKSTSLRKPGTSPTPPTTRARRPTPTPRN
ncbi:hypothetical protein DFJ73DRAFT_961425 [Zopfochytrium polystomum]|nr:hypothetical protein DFJ73DRAFT_961425 [Zopfochytrium polystomum]